MLNLRDRIKGKNENKEYTRTRIEVRDRLLAGGKLKHIFYYSSNIFSRDE